MINEHRKENSFWTKIFIFCIVLTCVFAFSSCSVDGTVAHDCVFKGTALSDSTNDINNFRNNVEKVPTIGATENRIHYYYLSKNVTLSSTLKIHEGTYVGICVGNFKMTVSGGAQLFDIIDTNGDGVKSGGGVFFFKCGTHAIHSKKTYQYIDQSAIDFFGQSGASLYSRIGAYNGAYNISLREDLHISAEYTSLLIPSGTTLNVCTNGHSFTYDFDMEAAGGKLSVFDCQDRYYHECLHLNDDATIVNETNFADLLAKVQNAQPGDEIHAYLKGDVSWSSEIVVPEGVTFAVCLNSHSATGSVKKGTYFDTVTNELTGEDEVVEKECGVAIFFDCSYHLCQGICTTGEMLAITEKSIGWTTDFIKTHIADPDSPATIYCVLEDDIDIPMIEGVNLVVCVNGFKNRDNEWSYKTVGDETVVSGSVIYYNCASAHICEIASLIGMENKAILLDTAEGVNYTLSQLAYSDDNIICFSLTSDLKGSGEIEAPEGTIAIICCNGFSMGDVTIAEGGNVFIYECGKEYCADMKNDIISFDQGVFDLFALYSQAAGEPYPFSANYIFAVSEDVVIHEGSIAVADGYTVNFCDRGHTITGADQISGVITHKGCTSRITPHLCAVSDMFGIDSIPMTAKSAGTINSVFSQLGTGVHLYHLTQNLVGSGEIVAPVNTVIGICLDGFSTGDVKVAEGSKVFFYECGKHYCSLHKTNIPTLDQGAFDFLAFLMNGGTFTVNYDAILAVSENVDINVPVVVADGCTLDICTCGNTVSFSTVSGDLVIHDDVYSDVFNHDCAVVALVDPGMSSTPLYATTVEEMNAAFLMDVENGGGFYHLTADIVGGGTLELPEEFMAAICLNGFSMDGVEIPDGTYAFLYECGKQYCEVQQQTVYSFDQGVFDLFATIMWLNMEYDESGNPTSRPAFYLYSDTILALKSDVYLPFDIIVEDGYTLNVCTCGYELTVPDGIIVENVVTHTNCLPSVDVVKPTENTKVIGCSVCNRVAAQPLNYATLRDMIDNKGNVILAPGDYYYYLENDFQLTRSLTIPDGVNIHICLHGYTLYSAYLWSDSTTFGGGYPEAKCMTVANVMSGASFNLYDCSEKMSGNIALRQFRTRNASTGRYEMTLYVTEEGNENSSEGLEAILSTIGSSIAVNYGTVNIYGGNIYAISGFINADGGVLNIYNGNIYAMFTGVFNVSPSNMETPSDTHIYIGEGATISSIYMGVYALGGEVVLDGGTVNASLTGIMAMSDNPSVPGSVTVNGGEVNVGSSARVMAASLSSWAAMGGEVLDFAGQQINIGEDYIGIGVTDSLTINGDVNIVMGEMTRNSADSDDKTAVDFAVSGGAQVNVSNGVNNKYSLTVDSSVIIGGKDVFIATEGAMKFESIETGEIIIVPMPEGFEEFAQVTDMSVSTSGDIKVNIYTQIDPEIAKTGRVRFYVEYAHELRIYTLDDAEKVNIAGVEKYVFSISTAAKDYAEYVNCYFALLASDSTEEDPYSEYVGICIGSQRLSIENYLDTLISRRGWSYSDSTVELAKAMKNYCAAAAYHFGTAENYAVVEGLSTLMEDVTVDVLDDYKPTKGEAFDTAPITFKTATLILKSETAIRIYFDVNEGFEILEENGDFYFVGVVDGENVKIHLTVTSADGETPAAMRVLESGYASRPYCIEITGIHAKNYFDMYTVKLDDQIYMTYSVASYARTIVDNKNGDYSDDIIDVAKAMIIYGATAANYYDDATGGDEGGAE